MIKFPVILAQQLDIPTPQGSKSAGYVISDIGLIFLIFLVMTAVLLFWALVIRGPKQQSSSRRIYKEADDDGDEGGSSGRRRKKKKTRRREHRKRNPTLAETGGLPEPRPPGSEPPI